MTRIVCGLLATIVLACMAAAPPRDPCYIVWTVDTPMLWMACMVDHGQHVLVTSTHTPRESDPIWWDMEQWALTDQVPALSPLQACANTCKDFCAPQPVKEFVFTAGDPPKCSCGCYPPPAPTTNPPPGNGSAD